MTQSRFDVLLKEVFEEFGDQYITVPKEMKKMHIFSKRFKRKMRQLMRHRRSVFFYSVRLPIRQAVAVLVLAFLANMLLGMGDPKIHEKYPGFYTSDHDSSTIVQCIPDENAPDRIETIYDLDVSRLSEDFELYWYENEGFTGLSRSVTFENKKMNIYIDYKQHVQSLTRSIDTEYYPLRHALVNDHYGLCVEYKYSYTILWVDKGYVFELGLVFDERYPTLKEKRELLVQVLRNIRIVETEGLFREEIPKLPTTGDVAFGRKEYDEFQSAQKTVYDRIKFVLLVKTSRKM